MCGLECLENVGRLAELSDCGHERMVAKSFDRCEVLGRLCDVNIVSDVLNQNPNQGTDFKATKSATNSIDKGENIQALKRSVAGR